MDPRAIAFVLIFAVIGVAGYQLWSAYQSIAIEFNRPLVVLDDIDRLGRIVTLVAITLVGAIGYYVIDMRGVSIINGLSIAIAFVLSCLPFLRADDIGEYIIESKTGGSYEMCAEVLVEEAFRQEGGLYRVYTDRPEACLALDRAMAKEDWNPSNDFFPAVKYISDWYIEQDSKNQPSQDDPA